MTDPDRAERVRACSCPEYRYRVCDVCQCVTGVEMADQPVPTMEPFPRFAIIHVKPDANVDAWPVVERVDGGWQSGVHHYPDAAVLDLTPLHLVSAETPR